MKLVLKMDEIDYVLTQAPPHIAPDEEATQEEITAYEKHVKDDSRGKCYLLASMNDELLKQHEDMDDCASILLHLNELYGEVTRSLRFNTICELVNTKMTKGTPVNQHASLYSQDTSSHLKVPLVWRLRGHILLWLTRRRKIKRRSTKENHQEKTKTQLGSYNCFKGN
ncbi:hypothetical protein ACE6H2_010754 [Prunus campanulata]